MAQGVQDQARRREALSRDLDSARAELAQLKLSLDRYEKQIEIPRVLAEIQRAELELEELDRA